MKPAAIAIIAGVLTIGAISYTGFSAAARAGEFTTLTPVFDGACRDIAGVPGAEDMAIDRGRDLVFISSDDRRAMMGAAQAGQPAPRGAIFALPLADAASAAPVKLETGAAVPGAFHPHGISLFTAADGARTLMAVNHPKGFADYAGTTVEVFDVSPDNTLTHRRTVAIPGLVRINDIVATGPDQFYATSESDLARGSLAETLGQLTGGDDSGSVWFFDGQAGKRLVDGIGFANSLALSPDGRTLYATGTTSRAIYIYTRDPATGGLERRDAAFLGTGVDNLDVEPDGRVWIAAHPKLMTFAFRHARDPAQAAPSQVIVLEPAASGQGGKVDQVYLKTGEPEGGMAGFSGASVAIRSGQTMVMGSVFEDRVRVCQLPPVWKQSESHPAERLLDPARDEAAKRAAETKEKLEQGR